MMRPTAVGAAAGSGDAGPGEQVVTVSGEEGKGEEQEEDAAAVVGASTGFGLVFSVLLLGSTIISGLGLGLAFLPSFPSSASGGGV